MKKWIAAILAFGLLAGCSARSLPGGQETGAVPEGKPPVSEPLASSSEEESGSEPELEAESQEHSNTPEEGASLTGNKDETKLIPLKEEKAPAVEKGDWALLLANHNHGVGDYTPELEAVQGQYQMDVRVVGAMKQMLADAKAQGVDLLVCSAYRPFSSQERNFNNSVDRYVAAGLSKDQAVSETKKLIAVPGYSEHQTGLAADIVTPSYQGLDDGYANTAAAKWLKANAAEYGFILRYPKDKVEITQISFEPWHYRYVGVEAAKAIMEQGLCLEEYLGEAGGTGGA